MTLEAFKQHKLLMVTDHGKGQLLAPLFQDALGMTMAEQPPSIATDSLGTFSGEIERPAGPLETLRMKAELVPPSEPDVVRMASEGSFGPHPELPFLPFNQEWVGALLPDGLFVTGYAQSTETNFQQQQINSVREAQDFFRQANQPATGHAIILTHRGAAKTYAKGLITADEVTKAYERLRALGPGTIEASTDMRAHLNPTRQQVILAAASDLIANLKRACPNCASVGFQFVGYNRGLPCSWCSRPTRMPLAERYQCPACSFEAAIPTAQTSADPAVCDWCNG